MALERVKPKRFDEYKYLNTDPQWFEEYREQELERIENGERDFPLITDRNAHGMAVMMEHEEFYEISYEDNIAPMEMPLPQPRNVAPEGYFDFLINDMLWFPKRWALVDPYEAVLLASRWGSASRHIIWLLWVSKYGQISFDNDKNLGDNLHTRLLKRLIYFAEYEKHDPDVRAKTLTQAANRLADQGWIEIFQDTGENHWLIQETPQLTMVMDDIAAKHPEEFQTLPSAKDAEEISGLVVDLTKETRLHRAGEKHWRARDGAHFYAPVQATGMNPRQPIEAVVRGTPTSTSAITPTFASFQQVSEIVTELGLTSYIETKNVSNQKIFQAMAEIREKPRADSYNDVEKCLKVFLSPDLVSIMDYVEDKLDPEGKDFLEHATKIEGVHGLGRIKLAIGQLPTKDGTQRHVLRQIRLLTIALIQDLLGTIGGQFVDWSEEIVERTQS